jgi:hypothetical protein
VKFHGSRRDVNDLFGLGETAKNSFESRMSGIHDGFAPPHFFIRGRGVVHRGDPKRISFMEVERAEIGLAQPRRVRQHCLENGLQLAWRAGDDLEHLGGRRLLLQRLGKVPPRLGEFAPVFFELLFQIGTRLTHPVNACSHLRSG